MAQTEVEKKDFVVRNASFLRVTSMNKTYSSTYVTASQLMF